MGCLWGVPTVLDCPAAGLGAVWVVFGGGTGRVVSTFDRANAGITLDENALNKVGPDSC